MRNLIAIIAVVISAQAQAPATASASASIAGQVVNLVTGAPVRDATVSLRGPYLAPALLPGSCTCTDPLREAVSDDQGRFQFSALAPGNYDVRARRQGYAEAVPGRKGAAIELLPVARGQQVADSVIKLPPTSVVTGKVLDANGDPVQNAQVSVVRPAWTAAGLPCLASVSPIGSTDDRGVYRLFGFTSGTYGLRVVPPLPLSQPSDPAGQAYPATYYPDVTDPAAMRTFAIGLAETRTIDFKLRKVAMVRLKGRLIGPNGLSGQGTIQLVETRMPSLVLHPAVASSGMDGSFEIWAPPGSYRIGANATIDREPASASQLVELRANTDGFTLQLGPMRSIRGSVKTEGKTPVDLHGVEIRLLSVESAASWTAQVRKEDSGFTFDSLTANHYVVRVTGLPANVYVKSVQYVGREIMASGLQPVAEAPLTVLVSAVGAARLEGTAHDAAGNPAAYAAVTLLPMDGPASSAQTGYTDAAGKFAFSAVRPGPYKVLAWETNTVAVLLQSAGLDALKLLDARAVTAKLKAGGRDSVDLIAVTDEERQKAVLAR